MVYDRCTMSSGAVKVLVSIIYFLLAVSAVGDPVAFLWCQNTEVLLLANLTEGIHLTIVPSKGVASSNTIIHDEYLPGVHECGRDYRRCNIISATTSTSAMSYYFIPAIGGVLSIPSNYLHSSPKPDPGNSPGPGSGTSPGPSPTNVSKILPSLNGQCSSTQLHIIETSSLNLLSVINLCDKSSLFPSLHQLNVSNLRLIINQRPSSRPSLPFDDSISNVVLIENQRCIPSSFINLYLTVGDSIYRTSVVRLERAIEIPGIYLNCSGAVNGCQHTYLDSTGGSGTIAIYTSMATAVTFDSCDNRAVHHSITADGIPYYCRASESTVYRRHNALTIENVNTTHVINGSLFDSVRFGRCIGSRTPYFVALLENGTAYIAGLSGVVLLAADACGVEHCTLPSFSKEDPNVFVVYDFGASVLLTVNTSRPFNNSGFILRRPLNALPRILKITNRPGVHRCGSNGGTSQPPPSSSSPPPQSSSSPPQSSSSSPPSPSSPSPPLPPPPSVVNNRQLQKYGVPVGVPGVSLIIILAVLVVSIFLGVRYRYKYCSGRQKHFGAEGMSLSSYSSDGKDSIICQPQESNDQSGRGGFVAGTIKLHESSNLASGDVLGVLHERRADETQSDDHRNLAMEKRRGASNIH